MASQPELIMRMLDRAHGSLTFGEIAAKINDTRSAIQKSLSYLYKERRISRVQDNDGIMHFNLTPHGKQWLAKADDQRNGSGERKIKYEQPNPLPKPLTAWSPEEGTLETIEISMAEAPLAIDEVTDISMAEASDLAYKLSRTKAVDVTEAHAKDTQTIVDDCLNASIKGMIQGAESSGYNKGFARGYEAGVKEAARQAYEDGQRSVMKKLEVLLCQP